MFEVVFLCGPFRLHHCAVFPDNLCCCATGDAVQNIIHAVAFLHALHPERDSPVFLLEHKSFHIHGRLRNNTTKLLGDILLRLGTETWEDMFRDLHPYRHLDCITNFNAKSVVSATMLYTKSRESVANTNQSMSMKMLSASCSEERVARAFASSF